MIPKKNFVSTTGHPLDDRLEYPQTITNDTNTGKTTMDAAKVAEISRRIVAKVAEGMTLAAAFDAVLGSGSFEALAADVYETLRATN